MTKVLLSVFAIVAAGWSAPVWLSTDGTREPSPARVTILASSATATEFAVEVPGVMSTPTTVSGASYTRLSLPGENFAVVDEGRPEVPKVSVLLGIPKGANVSIQAVEREARTFPLGNVYPLQLPQLDNEPAPQFTIDHSFYSRDVQYPGSDAVLIETGMWRDLGVANIQVYPVQVNPARGEVQVASRIRVRVEHPGALPRSVADWMIPTYARYIDNFAQLRLRPETDYSAGVRYLVIAHSNWSSNSLLVDSLLGWVKKRGYDVRMISKASYTAQEVKDSIRAEYNRYSPKALRWVLLVGEYNEVPMGSYAGVGYSDFWYKDLEPWPSGDNYPEIGLARISPSSATDLQNQVRKMLKYQKSPPATGNWLNNLTMVANSEDYPGKYSGCVRGIYFMPKPYWQPVLDTIMGRFKANADVTSAINAGIGILPYRGHGSATSWAAWSGWPPSVSWTTSNVDALSNGDLTSVVYNIACDCGNLSLGECLSEKWLRKYPGGGAASLAASQASYTYPNHGICSTLVRATCDTWTITVPGVRNYGNPVFNLADIHMRLDAYVAKYWPGAPYPDNIYMYNMLGDPAMPVWAGGMPQSPTVTHPATIPTGSYVLNVSVQVGGRAVEGALVCAWKGTEFYVAERTNNLGNAALDVNATSGGTVLITVSEGHAQHSTPGVAHTPILPYEGTATVGVTHDVACSFIAAPSGTVDSGTTVTPACSVANYGSSAETYTVRMKVGATYNQTVTVSNHPVGTRRYVTFPNWSAVQRGSHVVSCSTELAGDANPANDKKIDSVLVRVRDVGCRALLTPSGTVDSNAVLTPACTVYNYGSGAASYNVRMRIGSTYNNTAAVSNHAAGTALYLTFPAWTANLPRGSYAVTCSTELAGDVDRANDKRAGTVAVRVLDASTVALLAPSGTVDSGAVVTPACTVANFGSQAATYTVRMRIGATYSQTATMNNQAPGAKQYLTFPAWTAEQCIVYPVSCSTELTGDLVQANDKLTGSVTVRPRDVGCTRILVPTGTLDSASTATPACSVTNFSGVSLSYTVRMRIGGTYNQAVAVNNHPAGTRRYVTFPAWTANLGRGSHVVSCSTELAGDANPANDKATGQIDIRVRDVACQNLLAPSGTVDSGAVLTPACTTYNHGSVTSSFTVRLRVGSGYNSPVTVLNLPAGTSRYVTFPTWTANERGTLAVSCSTELTGDLIAANNRQTGQVDVVVRDVGCVALVAPAGTVDSGATVTPVCTVANFSTVAESYAVRLRIGTGYDRTASVVNQAPLTQLRVTFPDWVATEPGVLAVACSTELAGDARSANDKRTGSVDVRVRDAGCVAVVAPTGVVDSGTSLTPACTVANFGNGTETYAVRLRIGSGYDRTATVTTHAPGTRRLVTFPSWTAGARGSHAVVCSTELAGDVRPQNDKVTGEVDVQVHDVGCAALVAPAGAVDSGTVVVPRCTVTNFGTSVETYRVRLRIGSRYDQSVVVNDHAAGTAIEVVFPDWTAGPRGTQAVRCSTMLESDRQPGNDLRTGVVDVGVTDVATVVIVAPTGAADSGEVVAPVCTVANFGTSSESYTVRMRIGSDYDQSAAVLNHVPGTRLEVTFPDWTAHPRGMVTVSCSTELATDIVPANDKVTGIVGVGTDDVAVVAVLAPPEVVLLGSLVAPRARVKNLGSSQATFDVRFVIGTGYSSVRTVAGLARGDSAIVQFDDWLASMPGRFSLSCSTELAGDDNPANDRLAGTVRVDYPWPSGWREASSMPGYPSSRPSADGAWLTYDAGRGFIYSAKGNKTADFFSYSPARDSWATLAPLPPGREGKPPAKGSSGCADGSGVVYATKGNNTLGFYKYVAARDSWVQLTDVPLGSSRKKVKGGTDMVYVPDRTLKQSSGAYAPGIPTGILVPSWGFRGSPGSRASDARETEESGADSGLDPLNPRPLESSSGYVYLLKGISSEFYRYDPAQDSWQVLSPAPAEKWDKGSWLVYDDSGAVYAHQAKYHGFFRYDLAARSWGQTLPGMPLIGQSGRSKKSKDGGSAAWLGNSVYALKGGGTQEFWQFDPVALVWAERETMPQLGSSGRKKKVKAGADITATEIGLLFALKGNKTNELWRYVPGLVQSQARAGAQGASLVPTSSPFTIVPNPLRAGTATLRWNMTGAPARVIVYDASGRILQSAFCNLQSGIPLDLRGLRPGVYLVRLNAGGHSTTQKLVVQR
jgi:hypothetical protein